MAKDVITFKGKVQEVLPGTLFKVELFDNKHILICHISGKMRQNNINVLLGDTVTVEVTPYDVDKGRIIYRQK